MSPQPPSGYATDALLPVVICLCWWHEQDDNLATGRCVWHVRLHCTVCHQTSNIATVASFKNRLRTLCFYISYYTIDSKLNRNVYFVALTLCCQYCICYPDFASVTMLAVRFKLHRSYYAPTRREGGNKR